MVHLLDVCIALPLLREREMVSPRKDRIPSGLGLGQKNRHAITGREQPIDPRIISKNAPPPPLLKCTKSVGDLDKIRLTWQKPMSTFEARAATSPSPRCACKQYLPMISDIALWRKQGIREIKVCKKCPKVNPYCDAICDPILIKPFLDGAK